MAWITVTSDDILVEFNAAEKAAMDAVKGDDALASITAKVVAEFRDAVIASGHAVGEEGTMPAGLVGHAVALARWRFLLSLPRNAALQTDARKDAARRAETILDDIASGKRQVESPDGALATGGAISVVSERANKITGSNLSGL